MLRMLSGAIPNTWALKIILLLSDRSTACVNNLSIQSNDNVKFAVVSIRRGSRLKISEATADDAGTYECQARNVAGPVSSMSSSVQIHDPGKQ